MEENKQDTTPQDTTPQDATATDGAGTVMPGGQVENTTAVSGETEAPAENAEDTENTENTENAEDTENIEAVGDAEDTDDIDGTGGAVGEETVAAVAGGSRRRLTLIIAAICVVVLVVAGGVGGWLVWSKRELDAAKVSCSVAADSLRVKANEYDALVNGDAKAASAITGEQVKDATTVENLAGVLEEEPPVYEGCVADDKGGLDAASVKLNEQAEWYVSHKASLSEAVERVNASKLDRIVDDANVLLAGSDGRVADNAVRDELSRAIEARDEGKIAEASVRVNDSINAKAKADEEARAQAEAEAQAAAQAAAAAAAQQSYSSTSASGSGLGSSSGGSGAGSSSSGSGSGPHSVAIGVDPNDPTYTYVETYTR